MDLASETPAPINFPVWKTIKLGTGLKTFDDFNSAIKQMDMGIGDWANEILNNTIFMVSERECEVDLANVSVGDLGFKVGANRQNIIARALSFGLELCPAEVGPQLRLQYLDQPKGEWLAIGMEPVAIRGSSLGFLIEHGDNKRWLFGWSLHHTFFWNAESRFVFVRPRK